MTDEGHSVPQASASGGTGDDARGLSRRTVLQGAVAAGFAGTAATWWTKASARVPGVAPEWEAFDTAVRASFRRMGMVGAAVAVVSADAVLYTSTHGVRDVSTGAPVTNDTHYLVASTTKSMSSLLVATYVDEGLFGWDQPVVEVWPDFRAPTDELTRILRVRDLLGMDSGITEPVAVSGMHEGDPTVPQLLKLLVNLPVEHPPGTSYFYNNTVYAVGGYLPALALGTAPEDLLSVYIQQMRDRIYAPTGMSTATIADDPRGVVPRYCRGYGPDLRGARLPLAYGPVGSYVPVGGTLASLIDMTAYVRLHLRRGNSVDGIDVVSDTNLAEGWKSHIEIPYSTELDPDTVSSGYGMGWIHQRFSDDTSLIWHNGGIDGFTTYIGFLPERDTGLVVLNNMNPSDIGPLFYTAVLDHLLSEKFGLNQGVAERVHAFYDETVAKLRELSAQTAPVNRAAVAPFLGYYEAGYRLSLDDGVLRLTNGPRTFTLRAMPDGSYVTTTGLLVGIPVNLTRRSDGGAQMELVGIEKVGRTVGPT